MTARRWVGACLAAGPLLAACLIAAPVAHITFVARGRRYDVSTVPRREVGLVLGARAYPSGPSQMLAERLDLAIELYRRGRVEKLMMSGDGLARSFNEPEIMRRYVVERGVLAEHVLEDPGGFDTYDSCIRARDAFGCDALMVISHDFHVPRALTICRWLGIDGVGVGDTRMRRRNLRLWLRSVIRELGANLKMEYDLFTNRHPRYRA